MTCVHGRELYTMEAPYTTLQRGLTPDNVSMAPFITPTLIVRQNGANAWESPFVAVFQPVKGEKPSVQEVKQLVTDEEKVALYISSDEKRKDYIFSATSSSVSFPQIEKVNFQGTFGLITDVSGQITQLYMVDARKIKKGQYAIEADIPVSASVFLKDGKWVYSSTGKAKIKLGKKVYTVGSGFELPLK